MQKTHLAFEAFADRWQTPIRERCNNNQKTAVWYLWLRFLMALRSLRHLERANDLSGCYLVARCCLECSVSLASVSQDATLADDYMAYYDHAIMGQITEMRNGSPGDPDFDLMENIAKAKFGPNFPAKPKVKWDPGMRKLFEKAGRKSDYQLYKWYCQMAHAPISGLKIIAAEERLGPEYQTSRCRMLLELQTGSFVVSTGMLIDIAYGSLWTQEKQNCSDEFESVKALWVSHLKSSAVCTTYP